MNIMSHGVNSNINITTEIAGIAIAQLVRQYGSPLLVYEEKALRDKMCARNHAFKQHYPKFFNSWSFQNNYREEICALLYKEGAIARLSNQQEYEVAKGLDIPDNQISFKGSLKNFESLESAVKHGATIIIDHWCEIEDLEAVASHLGQVISIGMQLNVNTGIQAYWSSIGFNLDSFQALDTIERIAQNNKLQLNGFYCPIKSRRPKPNDYIHPVAKILDLAYKIEDRYGWMLEFIDLGESLPALNHQTLKERSAQDITQFVNKSIDEICDAVKQSLRPGHTPKLILDATHDVINESGTLIVQTSPKDDTRPNDKLRTKRNTVYEKDTLLPLCRGDRLIFSNVGLYPQLSSPKVIDDIPCEVMIRESGQVEVIRHKYGQTKLNQ